MPLLPNSAYRPALPFRNGHVQTVFPALFRKLVPLPFVRERIGTPDGDFLDLDWLRHPRKGDSIANAPEPPAPCPPLAILTHGLEGSASQIYILGMARALFDAGWDILAWNFRGCSGEPNLSLRSYHSGATDDLQTVINHATGADAPGNIYAMQAAPRPLPPLAAQIPTQAESHALPPLAAQIPMHTGLRTTDGGIHAAHVAAAAQAPASPHGYRRIALVGFSLGGNIVLKYLGDQALPHTAQLLGAVAISVPCDLAGSTQVLERRRNRIYMERFLKTLRSKILEKHQRFPGVLNISGLDSIRTFREFDGRYTAPIHGFRDADHYWHACSCLRVIEQITTPTLLLNAADDPFLSPGCFPTDIAQAHPFLHLQMPRHGGHVGFVRHGADGLYYSELRAREFLADALASAGN